MIATMTYPEPTGYEGVIAEAHALAASSSAPRKHHLIPRSYLERWAEKNKIRVVHLKDGDPGERTTFLTSPSRAAKRTDFYLLDPSPEDPENTPSLFNEVVFGRLENRVKLVLDSLCNGQQLNQLTGSAQVDLLLYISMQFCRGETFRRDQTTMWIHRFERVLEHDRRALAFLSYSRTTASGKEALLRQQITESEEFIERIRSGKERNVFGVWMAEAVALVSADFDRRTWFVIETAGDLITCDEPVVYIAGPGFPRDEQGGPEESAVVVFPVSPKFLLAGFRRDAIPRGGVYSPLTIDETREINMQIMVAANRELYERPVSSVSESIILSPRPTSDIIPDRIIDHTDKGYPVHLYRKKLRWAGYPGRPWPVRRWWST